LDTHPAPKSATHAEIEGYNEELILAAKNGNRKALESLLERGAAVGAKDEWG
jgi:hypothetical protein